MQRRWYVVGAAVVAASALAQIQLNLSDTARPVGQSEPAAPPVADRPLPGMVLPGTELAVESAPPAASVEVEIEKPGAKQKADLAAILAAARKQAGPLPEFPLSLVGEFSTDRLRLPVSLTYEKNGRYRLQLSGTGEVTAGFDGRRNWTVSSSEAADDGALIEGRIPALATWVLTGAWLLPKGPCSVQALEESNQAGIVTLSLRARSSKDLARLILDSRTHRPLSLVLGSPRPKEIWRFEDYRTALGVTLPYRLTQTKETGTASYRFNRVSEAPPYARSPFHLALEPPPAVKEKTAVVDGRRGNGTRPANLPGPGSPDPQRQEAAPPCEPQPQVVEHAPAAPKGMPQSAPAESTARMNTELAPAMELGSPSEEVSIPAPKPGRGEQEKPTLNLGKSALDSL